MKERKIMARMNLLELSVLTTLSTVGIAILGVTYDNIKHMLPHISRKYFEKKVSEGKPPYENENGQLYLNFYK